MNIVGLAMTLDEIAAEPVAGCREGREPANLDRLYAPDAVSVEAADMDGRGAARHGLAAIREKHAERAAMSEVHSATAEGPFRHQPDRFAAIFGMDVAFRQTGQRSQMRDVAVSTVANGRIVHEAFHYGG